MSDDRELGRLFLEQVESAAGEPIALGERIAAHLQAGRAAWPGVEVPAADFVRHLSRHAQRQDPAQLLDKLLGADLYLACGCTLGLPEALAAFEQAHMQKVPAMIGHMKLDPGEADEVAQRVRTRLFVRAGEEPPKIASYSGGGPLGGWLRAVVVRTALNLRRERGAASPAMEEALLGALALGDQPELDYIKGRHREDVLRAMCDAFLRLPREQRNVLRLHHGGGLSGDRIAVLLGKSRATVVRWLTAARESMLREVHALLQERLACDAAEVESLIALVRSRLDLSLSVILRDSEK